MYPIFLHHFITPVIKTWYLDPAWWSAIGTIFVGLVAVVIALLQEKFRRWLSNTYLEVSLKTISPDCHKIKIKDQSGVETDSYYVRARIDNVGKYAAENVEVMIVDLYKYNEKGIREKVKTFLPMNLVWSHYHGISMSRILPGHFRHVDIGFFILTIDNQVVFKIDTAVQPNKVEGNVYPNVIDAGHYEFTLIIGANNTSTFSQKYSLVFTNDFYLDEENMFKESVKIKAI